MIQEIPDHIKSHRIVVVISEHEWRDSPSVPFLSALTSAELARVKMREKSMRFLEYEIPTDLIAQLNDHIPSIPHKVPFRTDNTDATLQQYLNLAGLPAGYSAMSANDSCPVEVPNMDEY